jgi:ABC-type antimicrobial peptide transport system permease subunit
LKVLGFSPARIVSIYFAEVLIVATFGGIAGMVAAFGAIKSLGPMLTQIAPGMALSVEVLTIASLLIAVTSLLAVTAPAVFVLRLPALSSLQRS